MESKLRQKKTGQDIKWQIIRLRFSKMWVCTRTDTMVEVLTSGTYEVLQQFDPGGFWCCRFYYNLNNFLDSTTTSGTTTITTDAAALHLHFPTVWILWIWRFSVWLRLRPPENCWTVCWDCPMLLWFNAFSLGVAL
jgi:hypothetical protein